MGVVTLVSALPTHAQVQPLGETVRRGGHWQLPCPSMIDSNNSYRLQVLTKSGEVVAARGEISRVHGDFCQFLIRELASARLSRRYLPIGSYTWRVLDSAGAAVTPDYKFSVVPMAANNFAEDVGDFTSSTRDYQVEAGRFQTRTTETLFLLTRLNFSVMPGGEPAANSQHGFDFTGELDISCPNRGCSLSLVFGAKQSGECANIAVCKNAYWHEAQFSNDDDFSVMSFEVKGDGSVKKDKVLAIAGARLIADGHIRFRIVKSDTSFRVLTSQGHDLCFRLQSRYGPDMGIKWSSLDDDAVNMLAVDWLTVATSPIIPGAYACMTPLPETNPW